MYMVCKWLIVELLLEWGIDDIFVALGNCYCWTPLLHKEHGIHRISPPSQSENCEVVPPHNNVKSQNQKGCTTKTKERQTTPLQSPHIGKIIGLNSNG